MELDTIIRAIMEHGMSIVLVGYFIFKDYKFNQSILDVLGQVREVLVELRTWHEKEETR